MLYEGTVLLQRIQVRLRGPKARAAIRRSTPRSLAGIEAPKSGPHLLQHPPRDRESTADQRVLSPKALRSPSTLEQASSQHRYDPPGRRSRAQSTERVLGSRDRATGHQSRIKSDLRAPAELASGKVERGVRPPLYYIREFLQSSLRLRSILPCFYALAEQLPPPSRTQRAVLAPLAIALKLYSLSFPARREVYTIPGWSCTRCAPVIVLPCRFRRRAEEDLRIHPGVGEFEARGRADEESSV